MYEEHSLHHWFFFPSNVIQGQQSISTMNHPLHILEIPNQERPIQEYNNLHLDYPRFILHIRVWNWIHRLTRFNPSPLVNKFSCELFCKQQIACNAKTIIEYVHVCPRCWDFVQNGQMIVFGRHCFKKFTFLITIEFVHRNNICSIFQASKPGIMLTGLTVSVETH